jgi:hypothetical protein
LKPGAFKGMGKLDSICMPRRAEEAEARGEEG